MLFLFLESIKMLSITLSKSVLKIDKLLKDKLLLIIILVSAQLYFKGFKMEISNLINQISF